MAALREWHSARDGLGHADRPRVDNAFSLDTQSRRVCLSLANWRYSDPNSNSNSDINTNRDADDHADANSHCNRDFFTDPDTEAYTYAEDRSDAEAASYAAAAAVALGLTAVRCGMNRPRRTGLLLPGCLDCKRLLRATCRWNGAVRHSTSGRILISFCASA
jgi:hypothetical protein